jgi:hypothetical protein
MSDKTLPPTPGNGEHLLKGEAKMKNFIQIFGIALAAIITFSISGTSEAGQDDVAITPNTPAPIPVPYPNSVKNPSESKRSKNMGVKKRGVKTKSKISRSSGDEAGTLKGMVSSKQRGKVKFNAGGHRVKTEGKDTVRVLDMPTMNK